MNKPFQVNLAKRKRRKEPPHADTFDNVKHVAPFFKDIQLWIELPGIICTHTPLHASTLKEKHRWGDNGPGINAHGHIHSNPSPDGPYKCVCVEQINFTPIHIDEVRKG